MLLVFCKASCSFKIFASRVAIPFLNVFSSTEEDEGDLPDTLEILSSSIALMELSKAVPLYMYSRP